MNSTQQRWTLLSPFAVIALGQITARIAGIWLGVWAWIPLALVYWTIQGLLMVRYARPGKRFAASEGGRGWVVGSVIVGLIPLSILLLNYRLLANPAIFTCWLVFALINPWFEEGYWRGLLGDVTAKWPAWLSTTYTSVLFTASHPLMWGVHSIASRNWQALLSLIVMGWVWSYTYRRTGSLRWPVFAHMLVDLGNLAVPTFLNLYVPPH